MSDCPVRKQVFETARRMADKDLEGFERAVVLLKKRYLKKMVEEIEEERLLSKPLDIQT